MQKHSPSLDNANSLSDAEEIMRDLLQDLAGSADSSCDIPPPSPEELFQPGEETVEKPPGNSDYPEIVQSQVRYSENCITVGRRSVFTKTGRIKKTSLHKDTMLVLHEKGIPLYNEDGEPLHSRPVARLLHLRARFVYLCRECKAGSVRGFLRNMISTVAARYYKRKKKS